MIIFNKSDLRYSRVFFDKQPPRFMFWLIVSVLAMISIAIYMAYKTPKNYVVTAEGEVVITGTEYVSALQTGKVISLQKKEGETVKEGDLLLTLSSGEGNELQKNSLIAQLEKLRSLEAVFQKYEQSLKEKVNYMSDKGEEQEYYGKVENYLAQLNSESYTNQSQSLKIQEAYAQYNSIVNIRNDLQNNVVILQSQAKVIEEALAKLDTIETVYNSPNYIELRDQALQLSGQLKDIRNQISAINSAILEKDGELAAINASIKESERSQNAPNLSGYSFYTQLISELGEKRSANNRTISEVESNIKILEEQEKNYSLYASTEGTLHYLLEVDVGVSIQQTQVIAEVANDLDESSTYVEAFVLSTDISRISQGAKVDIAVAGVSAQKYGTLKGSVSHIDSGTVTRGDGENQRMYYKVFVTLEDLTLKGNRNNEVISVEKGMPVEARIVYDKETYLDWVLEMLNFSNK